MVENIRIFHYHLKTQHTTTQHNDSSFNTNPQPSKPLPSRGLELLLSLAFLSHFRLLGGDGDIAALWLRREAAAAACQGEFPPRQLLLPAGEGNAPLAFGVVGFLRFQPLLGVLSVIWVVFWVL